MCLNLLICYRDFWNVLRYLQSVDMYNFFYIIMSLDTKYFTLNVNVQCYESLFLNYWVLGPYTYKECKCIFMEFFFKINVLEYICYYCL